MEVGGGRQPRLLGRLLGKLRGDNHKYNLRDNSLSGISNRLSESTGCGSTNNDDDDLGPLNNITPPNTSQTPIDDFQFSANIDLRYGGQYLTPEQLPQFCDQLHNLVGVIKNIQSYARVTGEYPSELERRLKQEALEVASLAAEARNARDVIARARTQRKAVRAQKHHLASHLSSIQETEVREFENTVRLSDRKLFKNWEALKDSNDASVFEPILGEIRSKQTALDCLIRLIDNRQSALAKSVPLPQPLPPPEPRDNEGSKVTTENSSSKKHHDNASRRAAYKRRRRENAREARSVPLSSEPSRHGPTPQVTLYIQGTESSSRYRVGSAGAVTLTPMELPSGGSVRDILFFTTN